MRGLRNGGTRTAGEALLNAVIHKDYASGATIQISVYDDKLMIWNPGQLPPDWKAENLLEKHESKPFNPDVAHAFFRAGLVESWGRGLELILYDANRAVYGLLREMSQLCEKERLLEIVHDFIVFDAGIKKTCRHNQ